MSHSLSRARALLLGLIVLLGTGLAAAGLMAVGSRGWIGSGALHVQAGFGEIRGVEVGTRVRIQGIDAGEVVAIDPPDGPDGQVVLTLRLDRKYRHLVRVSSTVRIDSEGMLGGKVVEIRPPSRQPGQPTPDMSLAEDDTMLVSEKSAELGDVLRQMSGTLESVRDGEGTLGKLAKDPRAFDALVKLIENSSDAVGQGKDTMAKFDRSAEAMKKIPFVGGYIEDPVALLVRGNAERNRKVFAEVDLFEAGRSVLTAQGKAKLDEAAPWLTGLRHSGSDVVIATYADPRRNEPKAASQLTLQQSEAVATYLRDTHGAHRLGGWGVMSYSRKVTALGQGTHSPPVPERESLPSARVEVIVFVPQS